MKDNPRRRAVALAYDENHSAPTVVASGYGEVAERIVQTAKQRGIYVHDAPELVSLLMQLNLDEQIPDRLYQVVAEILIWAQELDERCVNIGTE
ncbi:EscU/YscU/HrcU family type III secretion system export apparatus switch protein [Microbulbifer aggregans]|uniref:EscU/YscU/HrcU family type III secretion system export apparatus switch protein n=1 Tax=Microbulbifer aggregans TaxID=1769779 RepID=UPI001CFE76CB|nr:EscU/YscU/HrcU family type III secretion system export apparatus switch protein [Microbulbifer aggregans]